MAAISGNPKKKISTYLTSAMGPNNTVAMVSKGTNPGSISFLFL